MTSEHGHDYTHHEQYTAQIWVKSHYLGQITYDSGREDLRWSRTGYALFCPSCGEVWAKLTVHGEDGMLKVFDVWLVSCQRHPDQHNVPGSVLAGHLIHLLGDMPDAVVRQEFEVHMEAYNGRNNSS